MQPGLPRFRPQFGGVFGIVVPSLSLIPFPLSSLLFPFPLPSTKKEDVGKMRVPFR